MSNPTNSQEALISVLTALKSSMDLLNDKMSDMFQVISNLDQHIRATPMAVSAGGGRKGPEALSQPPKPIEAMAVALEGGQRRYAVPPDILAKDPHYRRILELREQWPRLSSHRQSLMKYDEHCANLEGEPKPDKIRKLCEKLKPEKSYWGQDISHACGTKSKIKGTALLYFFKISGLAKWVDKQGLVRPAVLPEKIEPEPILVTQAEALRLCANENS